MSKIAWTDVTWNPVVGCTPVSPGCLNCYAATMARRQEAMGTPGYEPREREDLVFGPGDWRLEGVWCKCGGEVWVQDMWKRSKAEKECRWEAFCAKCKACDCNGYSSIKKVKTESPAFWGDHRIIRIAEVKGGRAVFTGEVRWLPDRLEEPLHWRKPRRVFVNSMSDLFHESVPFEFIDRVFAVMALCPQHTFQVLTKRPERMAEYFNENDGLSTPLRVWHQKQLLQGSPKDHNNAYDGSSNPWPLPNVWCGASCEDQTRLDERVPHLLKCPAAVRFLSLEPLLGPVDLSAFFGGPYVGLPGDKVHPNWNAGIDWVIVGGESGPKARPCDVAWIRSVVQQCKAAGVACFVKQLGARPAAMDSSWFKWADEQGWKMSHDDQIAADSGMSMQPRLHDRKGGDPTEWPEDLRVREWPRGGGR